MFGCGAATRIYLAPGATDMRKSFEGLYGLVRDRLQCDPLSGHVFLFANARRNRMKLMFWDTTGLWVCAKRLEKGCFRWPEAGEGQSKVVLSHEQFATERVLPSARRGAEYSQALSEAGTKSPEGRCRLRRVGCGRSSGGGSGANS